MRSKSGSEILLQAALAAFTLMTLGCGSKPTEPPPLLPTFTVSGTIKARSSLQPLSNVSIEGAGRAADNGWKLFTVLANQAGEFEITGVRESVAFRVIKAGFYTVQTSLVVTKDERLDVLMDDMSPPLPEGSDLVLGQTVSTALSATDVKCDPQWDANAPCRRYGFAPATSRRYDISLRPTAACGELELHVIDVTDGGARVAWGSQRQAFAMNVNLLAGHGYEIRIMAYYSCEAFEVTLN